MWVRSRWLGAGTVLLAVCALIAGCSVRHRESPAESAAAAKPPVPPAGRPGALVQLGENQLLLDTDSDPDDGDAPLTVHFTAGPFIEDDVQNPTYKWDFGDGTQSQEQNPTHTYANPGDYTAVVTMTDGDKAGSDDLEITVHPPKKGKKSK